jgi:hypothetical protein
MERQPGIFEGIFQNFRWIGLDEGEFPDRTQGIPKQKSGTFNRTEEVAEHWEPATLYPGEQERRPPCTAYPPLDRTYFEIRVDVAIDVKQVAIPLKINYTFPKIAVPH